MSKNTTSMLRTLDKSTYMSLMKNSEESEQIS